MYELVRCTVHAACDAIFAGKSEISKIQIDGPRNVLLRRLAFFQARRRGWYDLGDRSGCRAIGVVSGFSLAQEPDAHRLALTIASSAFFLAIAACVAAIIASLVFRLWFSLIRWIFAS